MELLALAFLGVILWIFCIAMRDHLKHKREFRSQVIQGIQDINDNLTRDPSDSPIDLEDKYKYMEAVEAKLMTRRVDKQAVDSLLKEIDN